MFRKIGPGVLVAAAFIGPGTVTVCTLAGAGFGFSLLWALLIAVVGTVLLQEMAARLGLVTGSGLADAIRLQLVKPVWRILILSIVFSAIVIGNAAYEAGNVGGAALGLEAVFGAAYSRFYAWGVGGLAFLLLWAGSYKLLERAFVGLVLVMSISFLVTAFVTSPNWSAVLAGLVTPEIPEEGLLTVIALVGTTVVPYNLFLHASLVSERWSSRADLKAVRWDTVLSICLGGLVSMAIVISAAAIPGGNIAGAIDLAKGLEPLYGDWARYFMGIGLFAAGVTSAITAPLAAAYVAKSCFHWQAGMNDWRFRLVWGGILLIGVLTLSLDIQPIELIQFAQVANGILLPVIAVILLWLVNQSGLMGSAANTRIQNLAGAIIIMLALLLGGRSIFKVIGVF